jgi:hypothetical protein
VQLTKGGQKTAGMAYSSAAGADGRRSCSPSPATCISQPCIVINGDAGQTEQARTAPGTGAVELVMQPCLPLRMFALQAHCNPRALPGWWKPGMGEAVVVPALFVHSCA